MLDVIAAGVVGFGFLTAFFSATTTNGRLAAIAMLVGLVALASVALKQRENLSAALAPDASSRARDSIARANELVEQIQSDAARLRELCSQYPQPAGC
jgi:hypothetical protein